MNKKEYSKLAALQQEYNRVAAQIQQNQALLGTSTNTSQTQWVIQNGTGAQLGTPQTTGYMQHGQAYYITYEEHRMLLEQIALLYDDLAMLKKERKPVFGLFTTSKLRMQLEEMKHKHRLEVDAVKAEIEREKKHWEEDKSRELSKLREDSEIKLREAVTLAKLESEQRIKKAELDAEKKLNLEMERLNKEYYGRLSESLKKLHEEGNVTTKFTQELAIKMLEGMPAQKVQTKVLTGKTSVED